MELARDRSVDMRNYVGLDVSLRETAICVVDENCVTMREGIRLRSWAPRLLLSSAMKFSCV